LLNCIIDLEHGVSYTDLLEDMSFEEGSAYNERLIPIARGEVLPDRNVPVEWIMYDLWESMRAHDRPLADDILEPTFTFMRAQTDKTRLSITGMGPYLVYREKDVGKAYVDSCPLFGVFFLSFFLSFFPSHHHRHTTKNAWTVSCAPL
jgi:hypothetical protein